MGRLNCPTGPKVTQLPPPHTARSDGRAPLMMPVAAGAAPTRTWRSSAIGAAFDAAPRPRAEGIPNQLLPGAARGAPRRHGPGSPGPTGAPVTEGNTAVASKTITVLEVGEPYPHPDTFPTPGAIWYPDGGHLIVAALDNVTPAETQAFLKPTRFDLCCYGGLLVLLMWPGGFPHPQELGFSLLPPEASTFTLPAHDDGRVAVHLAVVEQTTGIVAGLNELTWPPHFTYAVHQQLLLRARHPMADQDAIAAATAAMRAQYPNSIDLMDRSIAHCTAD